MDNKKLTEYTLSKMKRNMAFGEPSKPTPPIKTPIENKPNPLPKVSTPIKKKSKIKGLILLMAGIIIGIFLTTSFALFINNPIIVDENKCIYVLDDVTPSELDEASFKAGVLDVIKDITTTGNIPYISDGKVLQTTINDQCKTLEGGQE